MKTLPGIQRAAVLTFFGAVLLIGRAACAQQLKGSGSTFVYPIMTAWISEYHKTAPQLSIRYEPNGSGQGIADYTGGTVDFGATDAPLSRAQLDRLPRPTLQLPVIAGCVVAAYNVPGIGMGLRLSGDTLAEIFLGRITKWNDPRIKKDNPSLELPEERISVVHRSDGSGTTSLFTKYLSLVSPDWKATVGAGKTVSWPAGLGGNGNAGVASLVKRVPGSIGYVELTIADQFKLNYSSLKNRAGNYVIPSGESMTSAVEETVKEKKSDATPSFLDAPGNKSYPITGLTYLLLPQHGAVEARSHALTGFVQWVLGPGQKLAPRLLYATLPPATIEANVSALSQSTAPKGP